MNVMKNENNVITSIGVAFSSETVHM